MNKATLAAFAVLLVAGCSMTRPPAPVDDRRPSSAQAKPPATAPAAAAPRAAGYVVKRGDTLYSIALETGVDHRELARWNGCLLYTSPSPRDISGSRMPSSA